MGLVIGAVLGSGGSQPEPNDKTDGHLTYTTPRGTIGTELRATFIKGLAAPNAGHRVMELKRITQLLRAALEARLGRI